MRTLRYAYVMNLIDANNCLKQLPFLLELEDWYSCVLLHGQLGHLRTRKILQIVMYLCRCRSILCSLLGTEWIDFWKMGTNGLWYVSTVASSLPFRYWLKRLPANTIAKQCFSIWAYWLSTELNDLDANATGCPSCSIYLTTSTIWCGRHNRAGLQFKCVLTDNPPSPGEGWPHHRSLRPLLFSNSGVGSFTSYKKKSVRVLWDGTYGFSSLSENTRKSDRL